MKILIDTNVLISAALNPNGTPYKAFVKAVTFPFKGVICEQNIEELRRIFNRKFPSKISSLESFLSIALTVLTVIPIPIKEDEIEKMIRDVFDRPILRAAIGDNVDIILTGDKDFLESKILKPSILSPSQFLLFGI